MFSLYSRSRLHSFGEIVQPWRVLVAVAARDVLNDWDFAARNLRSARWLHQRIDVDFNGWFMCLIPRQVLAEIGLSLPLFIKWDDSEFGLRAQEARLPDGDLPGRRRVARPVDRQERRPRLAGLLPPPQPAHRGAAALAVPAGRAGGPREPQPPDQAPGLDAVLHRRAAAPWRSRTCSPGRDALHGSCRPAGRGQRLPQAVHRRRSSQADPDAFPPVRRKKPPRKGKDEHRGARPPLAADHRRRWRRCGSCRPRASSREEFPEAELAAHGRQVVPPRRATTRRRLDARRHLRGALPPRPGSSSATCAAHRRASTSAAAASGRRPRRPSTAPRSARSPRRRPGRRPSGPGPRPTDRVTDAVTRPRHAPSRSAPTRVATPRFAPRGREQGLLEVFRHRYLLSCWYAARSPPATRARCSACSGPTSTR